MSITELQMTDKQAAKLGQWMAGHLVLDTRQVGGIVFVHTTQGDWLIRYDGTVERAHDLKWST